MAPVFDIKPYLERRQNAQPYQVTMTVTRATTTYATTVILGGIATQTPPSPATTTAAVVAQPTVAASSHKNGNNTGVIVGAIFGSLGGILLLWLIMYKCCYDRRSTFYWNTSHYSRYDDSDTSSTPSRSSRSTRTRARRGGSGWGQTNEHGHRVELPRRTYERRERKRSVGSSSGSRSERTSSSRNRRRSDGRRVSRDGFIAWMLGRRRTISGSVYARRESVGESRRGRNKRSIDD